MESGAGERIRSFLQRIAPSQLYEPSQLNILQTRAFLRAVRHDGEPSKDFLRGPAVGYGGWVTASTRQAGADWSLAFSATRPSRRNEDGGNGDQYRMSPLTHRAHKVKDR